MNLFILISLPLVGSFLICIFSNFAKELSFYFSSVVYYLSLFFWIFFDNSAFQFQYLDTLSFYYISSIDISFGIDGLSLFFILLTTFLLPLCFLFSWQHTYDKSYYISFLILESFILIVFSTLDVLFFYIFFESVLIPMFFIIGFFGTRSRRFRAGFLLFLYTLFGSLFILVGLVFLFFESGSLDYLILIENQIPIFKQKFLWLTFFVGFAIKVPLFPFHLWLPEAHVEAPTSGSVILAGVLLKLGTYGFLRLSIPLFPFASVFYKPFIFVISTFGVVYASMIAIRQSDVKRVIAYASVSHISLIISGLFTLSYIGFESSLFQIISHGLVSAALFFCVGVVYSRFGTRLIKYYSGLVHTIPTFIFTFLFFTLANIGFPGTSNFIGEFITLLSIFNCNPIVGVLSASSLVFGAIYSLWLFNRISYGSLKVQYISFSRDLISVEFFTFFPLVLVTVFFGLCPSVLFNSLDFSCSIISRHFFLYGFLVG